MQARLPDPHTPENWLRYARSDLTLAQSFEVLPEVLLETFCFHAQQAAEKSLKAVLLQHNLTFPYTHDLSALVTIIQNAGISWETTLNSVVDLTRYAVAGRYPNETEALNPGRILRGDRDRSTHFPLGTVIDCIDLD